MAKRLTLVELLGNIGITSMGEGNAALIRREHHISTIEDLMCLTPVQIELSGASQNRTIGRSQADQIYESLRSPRIQAILQKASTWLELPASKERANEAKAQLQSTDIAIDLKGKKVCFTGTAPISRKDLTSLLEAHGAVVQSSVNKETEILFIADPNSTSSKAVSARKNGTQILAYTELGI